ncbi:MAG: hypothetical protein AAGI07_09995 [Bacteroidota bacterium]
MIENAKYLSEKNIVDNREQLAILILKFAFACLLVGRIWQHFFWTTPYGVFLPFLESETLKLVNYAFGSLLLLTLTIIPYYNPFKKWQFILLLLAVLVLLLEAIAYWVTKSFRIVQLFEYSIQVSLPYFLHMLLRKDIDTKKILYAMRISIALTFTAHGLYALSFPYSTPANFIEMTQNILKVTPQQAILFLFVAGLLDLLLSIGLFFQKTAKASLVYAVIWGSLTALARTVAYFDFLSPFTSLHRWMYETIHRVPHAALPLVLLILLGYLAIKKKAQDSVLVVE